MSVATLRYTSDVQHDAIRAERRARAAARHAEQQALRELETIALAAQLREESEFWGIKMQGWRTRDGAEYLAWKLVNDPDDVRDYWPVDSL
jgi:hypothetical protein